MIGKVDYFKIAYMNKRNRAFEFVILNYNPFYQLVDTDDQRY